MGKKTDPAKLPKIFNVNWFRLDEEGHFMWPGFGDNFRVLEWIIKRCEGQVDAVETPIGYVPKAEDINLEGLDYQICEGHKFTVDDLKSILTVENEYWLEDVASIRQFYDKIQSGGGPEGVMPKELLAELDAMEARLKA
jgi:phosphoenolpyruvate carboxykinase (GTP)